MVTLQTYVNRYQERSLSSNTTQGEKLYYRKNIRKRGTAHWYNTQKYIIEVGF